MQQWEKELELFLSVSFDNTDSLSFLPKLGRTGIKGTKNLKVE